MKASGLDPASATMQGDQGREWIVVRSTQQGSTQQGSTKNKEGRHQADVQGRSRDQPQACKAGELVLAFV